MLRNMSIRQSLPQIVAVMVKNWLMISLGMSIGYTTILIGGVFDGSTNHFGSISANQVSWLGSTSTLSIFIGSLLSGIVTQRLGRKRSMQLVTIPFLAAWLLFYFSNAFWQLYLGLGITGLFGGLVEASFCAYVSEITEPQLRGTLTATGSMSIFIGLVIQFLLGTNYNWRKCALISCAFPTITFLLFCFVPESPYWLIMNGKAEEAKKSLAWLRGWKAPTDVAAEIDEIANRHESGKCFDWNDVRRYLKRSFTLPLLLIAFMFLLHTCTGLATLETYSVSIMATMDVPINAYYATLILGVSSLSGSSLCIILVHRLGKRVLLFISLGGLCVCNLLIAAYTNVANIKDIILEVQNSSVRDLGADKYGWIPFTLLIMLSIADHVGNSTLAWVVMAEVFSHETRLLGCGLGSSISYLLRFFSNYLFLKLIAFMTLGGVYYLYGSISLLGIIVLFFVLPETEGKTLEEVSDHFQGISKLDNKVRRKKKVANCSVTPVI
uniref:Major facilitator superfamily (MFS) profile domain-containing protein n=1 Tax=Photinus pyralis TaxID=7054 RepID=A0A1Y1MTD9_PHOPY